MKSDATKAALAEVLKQLLSRKPISKITINDITEQCGISRMTFYYHFKDIYDLAQWTVREAIRPVLGEYRAAGSWQQALLNLLTALQENKVLIQNVYHSMDRVIIERYMLREAETLLTAVVETESAGIRISEEGKRRIATFYSFAFIGTILEWVRQSMAAPPQEVVTQVSAILQGNFRNAIQNVSQLEKKAE